MSDQDATRKKAEAAADDQYPELQLAPENEQLAEVFVEGALRRREQVDAAAEHLRGMIDSLDEHVGREEIAEQLEAARRMVLGLETEAAAEHDHAGEPKVWCETHQHEHIARMPRFTYLCKDCGWGQWYGDQAREHEFVTQESLREAHSTYEVEHVTRPISPAEESDEIRQQVEAYQALCSHRFFSFVHGRHGPFLDEMLAALDRAADLEVTVNELSPAPEDREITLAQVEASAEAIYVDFVTRSPGLTYEPDWQVVMDETRALFRSFARCALAADREVSRG